jgi:hypothetical protein
MPLREESVVPYYTVSVDCISKTVFIFRRRYAGIKRMGKVGGKPAQVRAET